MPADQRAATTTLVDAYQPRANDGANFRDAGLLPPPSYLYPHPSPPSSSPNTASTGIVATLFTLCPVRVHRSATKRTIFYQLNLYALYRDISGYKLQESYSSSSSSSSSSRESLPVKAQKLTYYFWSKSAQQHPGYGGITSGGLSWCGLPKATNLFPGVTPKGRDPDGSRGYYTPFGSLRGGRMIEVKEEEERKEKLAAEERVGPRLIGLIRHYGAPEHYGALVGDFDGTLGKKKPRERFAIVEWLTTVHRSQVSRRGSEERNALTGAVLRIEKRYIFSLSLTDDIERTLSVPPFQPHERETHKAFDHERG
ncbi:LOW QUALITY PROTEIN: hypothetical protein V1478_018377 [Vespula squamosa]|uniref:Uncharacterized protein n=1 Tax=Vespula squamosa TaxID=30214 RepID=A0ABD1ZUV6_VESSQ